MKEKIRRIEKRDFEGNMREKKRERERDNKIEREEGDTCGIYNEFRGKKLWR